MTAGTAAVRSILAEAQRLGFLGPRPIDDQLAHATGFAELLEGAGAGPAPFLDLGSGGGLPGFVLAERWEATPAVLLDASSRRTDFLRRSVSALGWADRVVVDHGRGEDIARLPDRRGRFGLVVARSFASPAVTAEIATGFLRAEGVLAVSEPPDDGGTDGRWPSAALADLGYAPAELVAGTVARIVLLRRDVDPDDRWPRPNGVPAKRPLW